MAASITNDSGSFSMAEQSWEFVQNLLWKFDKLNYEAFHHDTVSILTNTHKSNNLTTQLCEKRAGEFWDQETKRVRESQK